jgi:hypothetical protein
MHAVAMESGRSSTSSPHTRLIPPIFSLKEQDRKNADPALSVPLPLSMWERACLRAVGW